MKIKKLSPEKIALVKAAVKRLGIKCAANRERLRKEQIEELKYRDDAYYEFLDMMSDPGLPERIAFAQVSVKPLTELSDHIDECRTVFADYDRRLNLLFQK